MSKPSNSPPFSPIDSTDPNNSSLQSNHEDDQIFEIDIDQIYQDYIKSIDSKRSYVNIIGQNTSQLLQAISGASNAPTINNLVPAKTYQESRCHAFFRIIGFPVVNEDMSKFYNPGHDIIYTAGRQITLDDKIAIANNPITGFNILSNLREQYFLNKLKIFSTPNTVDAGVLSLSGGANPAGTRKFAAPFLNNQQPFDMTIADQGYPGVYTSVVGGGSPGDSVAGNINLIQYYDAGYNTPTTSLPMNKFHIIKPFIVDPRIDFACSPASNRIAVPFVPNKSFLLVSSTTYADPPLLETVIRDRFAVTNQLQNTGDYTQSFANFIKDVANNPDQSILGQIAANDIQQLATNTQFLQFVNIIQAMAIKLVASQNAILAAQSQYYWLPVPSTSGPEGGCTVQGVFLPPSAAIQTAQKIQSLVTAADGNILISTAQSLFSQTNQNPQATAAQGIPDAGGFAVSFKNSFNPNSTSSYANNSMVTLSKLTSTRQATLAKAGDALRTVEIIMGEFSGLGLCDMIAILATLYIMPPNDLIGFLDTDAQTRMSAAFSNQSFSPSSLQTSMTSFCSTLNQFYQLMDVIYQNELATQGLSV